MTVLIAMVHKTAFIRTRRRHVLRVNLLRTKIISGMLQFCLHVAILSRNLCWQILTYQNLSYSMVTLQALSVTERAHFRLRSQVQTQRDTLLACTGAKHGCAVKVCHHLHSEDFCDGTNATSKSSTTAMTVLFHYSANATTTRYKL